MDLGDPSVAIEIEAENETRRDPAARAGDLDQGRGQAVHHSQRRRDRAVVLRGQTEQETRDPITSDDDVVCRGELAAGVRDRANAVREEGFDRGDILCGEAHEEALERPLGALGELGPGPHAPALVGVHRATRAVMRRLDVRFGDVERLSGLADVVVEDIAQQEDGALERRQRLERQEEGEADALEELVMPFGGPTLADLGLKRGRDRLFRGLDRRRQPRPGVTPAQPAPLRRKG